MILNPKTRPDILHATMDKGDIMRREANISVRANTTTSARNTSIDTHGPHGLHRTAILSVATCSVVLVTSLTLSLLLPVLLRLRN